MAFWLAGVERVASYHCVMSKSSVTIKLVIFDFDGTLASSLEGITQDSVLFRSRIELRPISEAVRRSLRHMYCSGISAHRPRRSSGCRWYRIGSPLRRQYRGAELLGGVWLWRRRGMQSI